MFGYGKDYDKRVTSTSLYTIPQPFELSNANNAKERMARAMREAKESEQKECTFKP